MDNIVRMLRETSCRLSKWMRHGIPWPSLRGNISPSWSARIQLAHPFPAAPEFTYIAPGWAGLEGCLALCAHWAEMTLPVSLLGAHPVCKCIHLISLLGFWGWRSSPLEWDWARGLSKTGLIDIACPLCCTWQYKIAFVCEDCQGHQTPTVTTTTTTVIATFIGYSLWRSQGQAKHLRVLLYEALPWLCELCSITF